MDNETKQRIADLRTSLGQASAGLASTGNWRNLSAAETADLFWLLGRLDSLILMEEVDFAFYKARVKDLEADLGEAHALLSAWRKWMGGDDSGDDPEPCATCDGHYSKDSGDYIHENHCPMVKTNSLFRSAQWHHRLGIPPKPPEPDR